MTRDVKPAIVFFILHLALAAASAQSAKTIEADPLSPILKPAIQSTVSTLLTDYRANRRYRDKSFPMQSEAFTAFQKDLTSSLVDSLGLKDWRVTQSRGKSNSLAGKFHDRLLQTTNWHGVQMEVHVIEIPETGDRVPAVVCLPKALTTVTHLLNLPMSISQVMLSWFLKMLPKCCPSLKQPGTFYLALCIMLMLL